MKLPPVAAALGSTILISCVVSACAATGKTIAESAAGSALRALVLKADNAGQPIRPRKITIRIEAAKEMNAGPDGKGLATVIRLYKLRDHMRFLALPEAAFGMAQHDKQVLENDLIEVRELTLTPGQTLDIIEQLAGDAASVGIVTLFRSPAPHRWRFAFAAADAAPSGITVGVHACAMTATKASPVGIPVNEAALLSSVRCK